MLNMGTMEIFIWLTMAVGGRSTKMVPSKLCDQLIAKRGLLVRKLPLLSKRAF